MPRGVSLASTGAHLRLARGCPTLTFAVSGADWLPQVDSFSFGVVLWELITKEQAPRGNWRDVRVPEECPAEVETLLRVRVPHGALGADGAPPLRAAQAMPLLRVKPAARENPDANPADGCSGLPERVSRLTPCWPGLTPSYSCAWLQGCINEDADQRPTMKGIVDRLLSAEGLPADETLVEDKSGPPLVQAAMFDSAKSL